MKVYLRRNYGFDFYYPTEKAAVSSILEELNEDINHLLKYGATNFVGPKKVVVNNSANKKVKITYKYTYIQFGEKHTLQRTYKIVDTK